MKERTKILLTASVNLKREGDEGFPTIILRDKDGTTFMGDCLYNSVESLARIYQADREYRTEYRGHFDYYIQWEGNMTEEQLFQKPVIHGYGEPNTYIDETDKH